LEVYGNLIYHQNMENDVAGEGIGNGHGVYLLSKKSAPLKVRANVVHSNGATGIRVGDVIVYNALVTDNIVYNQGIYNRFGGNRDFYIQGSNREDEYSGEIPGHPDGVYEPMHVTVLRNYSYHLDDPGPYSESMHLGMWSPDQATAEVRDNYIVGAMRGDGTHEALKLGYKDPAHNLSVGAARSARNTIIGITVPHTREQIPPGVNGNVYLTSKPKENRVFVVPNEFEAGRANVAIYNWQLLPAVTVPLADVRLVEGQAFEVKDAMNFYGPPVARGVFSAKAPMIAVPMQGLVREKMRGEDRLRARYRDRLKHTAPEFGAFLVIPGAKSVKPEPTCAPTPAAKACADKPLTLEVTR
jgi:hypothetical protein